MSKPKHIANEHISI